VSKPRIEGVCHICGNIGPLSFEHVPPNAAFNDRPVVAIPFEQAIDIGPGDELPRGKIQQRGMGDHTLCERCNNNTGSWYGPAFVEWCYQGLDILIRADGRPTLIYLHYIFPLQIIKQISTMFFSAVNEQFQEHHQELVEFVLNSDKKYLPPQYGFYVYYNIQGTLRFNSIVATLNLASGQISAFSEITYPPYGYVMTVNNTPPPHDKLYNISHFARYAYNEFDTVPLRLPVLPTFLTLPGDYRTLEEIQDQKLKSQAAKTRIRNRSPTTR
jgi:hypothetical protein